MSKKVENLEAAVALLYNFCQIHQTSRVAAVMQAGVADHSWPFEEILGLLALPAKLFTSCWVEWLQNCAKFVLTLPARRSIKSRMTCPIPGGFLVAIDGIDGSGKTTQAELLARFCEENRLSYVISKEPTKGKYGHLIRDSAIRGRMSVEEEIEILDKDRREHVEQVIKPALNEEKIVILDRYYFSTAAYQGAHGADAEWILRENETFAPEPDLFILLDVPPELGLQRIVERGDEPNKFESMESLERARNIFNHIDRPYKVTLDARSGIPLIWFWVSKHFQVHALNKISRQLHKPSRHAAEDALNRTREFFGEDRLPMVATA